MGRVLTNIVIGKHDVGTLPRRGGRKTQSVRGGRSTDSHHHHHHADAASERAHSHV